jgi:TP53 regulating kinase-like protein
MATEGSQSQPSAQLPKLFQNSTAVELITQGAEGLVYRGPFLFEGELCAIKVRPRKAYRHPTLDERLTRQRLLAEARVLVRCAKEGIRVPGVLGADWDDGWLALEWIRGRTVRACLSEYLHKLDDEFSGNLQKVNLAEHTILIDLMWRVGRAVGKLHDIGLVHGDLTTSNLMLEELSALSENLEGEVVLIDFGLATQSVQDEDHAVDLYVLERAFNSTHPQVEELFKEVLKAYSETHRKGKAVLKRLEDVRLRGRKKSMLG